MKLSHIFAPIANTTVKVLTLIRGIKERKSNGLCRKCVQKTDKVSQAISQAQVGRKRALLLEVEIAKGAKCSESSKRAWSRDSYREHQLGLIKERWKSEKFRAKNLEANIKANKNRKIAVAKTVSKNGYAHFCSELTKLGYSMISSNFYTNGDSRLEVECLEGHKYFTSRNSFKNFRLCPSCRINKPEKELTEFIKSGGVEVYNNDKSIIPPKELDLWIPSLKLAIEHCGLYWHSDKFISNENHRHKRTICNEKGIDLITIYENEWAHKQEIVKSIILNKLNKVKTVYARNCHFKEVKNAKDFFNFNHLMGYSSAKPIGLYLKDELVSCLSYKRMPNTKSEFEIIRFSSLNGYRIVGAFSKIVKKLITMENASRIVSYVDLRYGNGNSYKKLGFTKMGETLGWKWTDNYKTFNRLKCRANMDDRKLTQAQHAEELGWCKIYDAGQAKYELIVNKMVRSLPDLNVNITTIC